MSEDDAKLKKLEQKIAKFQQSGSQKKIVATNLTVNILTEILAAIIVGLAIGWFIDVKFETKPLAIIICMILSFMASIRRLMNL